MGLAWGGCGAKLGGRAMVSRFQTTCMGQAKHYQGLLKQETKLNWNINSQDLRNSL